MVFLMFLNCQEAATIELFLLKEMKRIHELGWITSKRLDKKGNILPCKSSNCGGYTLEARIRYYSEWLFRT